MFKNYCKTAFRNLIRNKKFSLINISGLAIGIASCLLIFIVVRYELSYDRFQPEFKNIYHVASQTKYPTGNQYTPGTPFPALYALRAKFPQITTGVLFSSSGSQLTVVGPDGTPSREKRFLEETGIFFADPQLFKIFKPGWLSGTPAILDQPNKIALTEKMAVKYFGSWQEAMGKFIRLDNLNTMQVGGIMQDPPGNSDFQFRAVASYITMKNTPFYSYSTEWGNTTSNEQLFMLLPPDQSVDAINQQLVKFSNDNLNNGKASRRAFFLRPLSILHFDERMGNMGDHVTSKSTLWTLSMIAVFILVMACINFINLSTVQAVNRSKEIGVRKVLGSSRWNLLWQMLGETAMIVIISIMLAAGIAELCLPYIKHIASIEEIISLFTWQTCLFLSSVFIIVTALAGLYPALIVSGFSPILALKNKINSASVGGISLRRSLVVLQFAISQVLIVGTLIALSQMNYIRHANLGIDKEAVLVVSGNGDSTQLSRIDAFKRTLQTIPGVTEVSLSSDVPSSNNNWGTNFGYDHKPDENFTLYLKYGDADYFKTFGLQFAAGGAYMPSDTVRGVVVNETLLRKLGVKSASAAIGKDIQIEGRWQRIYGVVRDFRTNSLKEDIRPMLITSDKRFYSNISAKIRSGNLGAVREQIQQSWDKFFPEYANQTFFMDEHIEEFYTQENQIALLYKIFSGIAVFISCLGLYGLVSFMAVQRKKEVGIRKVLGASVAHIIFLFSKEFTVLILIAFAIATPVAWYMMSGWLEHFVYRIQMHPGIFILAIGISVCIAWLTVGYKSFRAALINPAKSLKSE